MCLAVCLLRPKSFGATNTYLVCGQILLESPDVILHILRIEEITCAHVCILSRACVELCVTYGRAQDICIIYIYIK